MFIGVECPLGALPNAHTLYVGGIPYDRKQMEESHYMDGHSSRKTCQMFKFFSSGYKITGAPVNIPDEDGVCFKYIFANIEKGELAD